MATKKILIQVDVTTKSAEVQVNKVIEQMKQLDGATTNVTKSLDKNRAQSGLNNAILIELGRTASDASYGLQGMANNIGRLFELGQEFARTGKQKGSLNSALQDLKNSIFGVGGLLIGIQLLIGFLPKIAKLFKKNAEAVDEETQAIERQNKQIRENIQLRIRNADKAEEFINLFTEDFQKVLTSIEYDSTKVEAKLFEIAEQFKTLGIERAALLQDENITQGDRVQLAIALIDLLNKENEIQLKRNQLAKLGPDAEKGDVFRIKSQLVALRQEAFNIEEIINSIVEKSITVEEEGGERRAKVKTVAEGELATQKTFLETQFELLRENFARQFELFIDDKDRMIAELKALQLLQKDIERNITEAQKAELDAREIMQKRALDNFRSLSMGLRELGSFDESFRIASILIEKAGQISEVIMKTRETNAKIRLAGSLNEAIFPFAAPAIKAATKARILRNNIGSGIDIAGIVAAAAGGINAIRSKSGVPTSLGGGGAVGGGVEVEAPDFNVVGIGGVSQLGQAIGAQFGQPIRAYVVSSDVSTGQALERNITGNAKLD